MMCLYSKKVPAKDAAHQFLERVRRVIPEAQRVTKRSEDVEKSRYPHQDWRVASELTSSQPEQQLKELQNLLFSK
eukprot:4311351-Ditylum_brightwellii.AAC.1